MNIGAEQVSSPEKNMGLVEKIAALKGSNDASFRESERDATRAKKEAEAAKFAYQLADAKANRFREEGIVLAKIESFYSAIRSDQQKINYRRDLEDVLSGEQVYLNMIEALEKKRVSKMAENPGYAELVAEEIVIKKAKMLSPEIVTLVKEALEKAQDTLSGDMRNAA